jgi:two-component system cell cycle sensor histidine kinase/response regulator CckA
MTRDGAKLVLLAEDEPGVRNFIYDILKGEGLEVIQAFDGLDALEAARRVRGIDMLLSDLRMPRMGGGVLCKELKRQLPDLKVILFTGTPFDRAMHEDGCQPDVVLQKPLSAAAIRDKVREVLGQPYGQNSR